MSRELGFVGIAFVAQVILPSPLSAGEPTVSGPRPCAPYKVVVHTSPAEVVVLEGEGKQRHLKLFGHCKKKERSEAPAPPTSYYVPIPAMIPAPPPSCGAAAQPCSPPPPGCGRQAGYSASPTDTPAAITAAGQDLRATIERLKSLRAEREAEIAAIDAALLPSTPGASRGPVRATAVANPAPARNQIAELNDKIDYLAALIDALADDLRRGAPNRELPAFDELNGLRKRKP